MLWEGLSCGWGQVEVKLIRDPESKEPVVPAAPKILLHEGTTGTVRIEGTVMLQIEATDTPVKCRRLPAARRSAFSCRTYLSTFVLGGAAIEGGVWGEVATEVRSRNFFSGMS